MKKALIIVSSVALILFGALIALIITMQMGQNQYTYNTQPAQGENESNNDVELAAESAELEAMLQSGFEENNLGDADYFTFITSQEAADIALSFVGYGELFDDLLFLDDGVPTFEIDIRHEETRYMVYVSAAGGGVVGMNRFEDASQGTTTLPDATSEATPSRPTPVPTPTVNPNATPSTTSRPR